MLTTLEIRAIAQEVVNRTKSTARVDTGALKRSISFTLVSGLVTFRELYYGQFGSNSDLKRNAIQLMPYGISWKIIYTQFGGDTYEVTTTRQGRASQRKVMRTVNRSTSTNINALIARSKSKEKKDGENEN